MKKSIFKRISAVLLAGAMTLSMAGMAMAATAGSSTIDGTSGNIHLFKYENPKSEIPGDFTEVQDWGKNYTPVPVAGVTFKLYKSTIDVNDYYAYGSSNTAITIGDNSFKDALTNPVLNSNYWEGTTDEYGKIDFTDLPIGIYLVKEDTNNQPIDADSVSDFIVILPFTDPSDHITWKYDAYVYPKNTVKAADLSITKSVSSNYSNKGVEATTLATNSNASDERAEADWEIVASIPKNEAGSGRFSYKITDAIDTNNLTLKGSSLTATFSDGLSMTEGVDYTLSYVNDKIEFVLTSTGQNKIATDISFTTDPTVTITYTTQTIYREAMMGNDIVNIATASYASSVNQKYDKTKDASAKVYYDGITIEKVDGNGNALADAEFKLSLNGDEVYTITSGADGYVKFYGIPYGDYVITEEKAPSGYNKIATPINETVQKGTHASEIEVINRKGIELPLTGGTGTTMLTIGGVVLLLGAGFVYVASRKKHTK